MGLDFGGWTVGARVNLSPCLLLEEDDGIVHDGVGVRGALGKMMNSTWWHCLRLFYFIFLQILKI